MANETQQVLSPFVISILQDYAKRRKNEEYFEIEELFDILDSIAPEVEDE